MEAKELRIGNMVNTGYDCNVVRIDEFGATLNTYKGVKKLLYFHQTNIRPIPLTEEWLIKLGFENSYTSKLMTRFDYSKNMKIGYDFNNYGEVDGMEGFRYGGNYFTHIKHIHQLQNIYFAITGEELTIKI